MINHVLDGRRHRAGHEAAHGYQVSVSLSMSISSCLSSKLALVGSRQIVGGSFMRQILLASKVQMDENDVSNAQYFCVISHQTSLRLRSASSRWENAVQLLGQMFMRC